MCALADGSVPDDQVIFLESPTNPLIVVSDIPRIAAIAKSHPSKPLVVVDNTFAGPYYTQPLTRGADVTVNSTTKMIGGHSGASPSCATYGPLVLTPSPTSARCHWRLRCHP